MYKKHTPLSLSTALLLVCSFEANALQVIRTPEARDDHISLVAGVTSEAQGNVSSNDRYGNIFSIQGSWVGQYGTITSFNSNGEYTYELFEGTTVDTLPPGGIGIERFTYTCANEKGLRDTAQLIIDIRANPTKPIANDDIISVIIGVAPGIESANLSTNDRYGSIFVLSDSWNGQYGSINSFNSNGEYSYQLYDSTTVDSLPENGLGFDRFNYTLLNTNGVMDTAQLIVEVKANPNHPTAKDDQDSAIVTVQPIATGNVGLNDKYGSIFTLSGSKTGEYGTITNFSQIGDYTYELFDSTEITRLPTDGTAVDRFEYTYSNANGLTTTAWLTIDVSANPSQPVARDDFNSTVVDSSPIATGNVMTNDRYGNSITFDASTSGQYGRITSHTSIGDYTYELFAGTNNASLPVNGAENKATDRFRYTYSNEQGISTTAWLVIDINRDQPRLPIANNDHISAVSGVYTTAKGDASVNDYFGTRLSLNGSWTGTFGAITSFSSDGQFTYELYENSPVIGFSPGADLIGIDSFSYTYSNEEGLTDTARIIIDIRANPTQPIANNDYISTVVGVYTTASGNTSTNDRFGTKATLNGSWVGKYGTITSFSSEGEYTYELFNTTDVSSLPANGIGQDRFEYTYYNDKGFTSTAFIIIDVRANPEQPIAKDDFNSTVVDVAPIATGNVMTNDLYGTHITFDVSTSGIYGWISNSSSTGDYTYTLFDGVTNNSLPNDGTIATDRFEYTYQDEQGISTTAFLIIDINPNQPDLPLANDDYISTVAGLYTSASGNTSTNDYFGTNAALNVSWLGTYGAITSFTSDGEYTYELFSTTDIDSLPVGGGEDRFEYTYYNDKGLSSTAFIIIDIRSNPDRPNPGDAPFAKNDKATVIITTLPSTSGNVMINDRFGTTITFNGSLAGQYGFLSVPDNTGTYTYTLFDRISNADLPANGIGIETFSYTLEDAEGDTATAQLIIDVNAAPVLIGDDETLIARDDHVTIIPNTNISSAGDISTAPITGNVTTNDNNGDFVLLTSTPSTDYGRLVLQSTGHFTYELYDTAQSVIELIAGEVVTDSFTYQYQANSGETTTATLFVQIIGNPVDANGDTIFPNPDDEPYDNVDVEFNDLSSLATPLNSARNLKGHLHDSGDKDWFFLSSEGNEIITLEVCPKGTSCFDKKSWVLYVFDSDLLTEEMETKSFQFTRWLHSTGTDIDYSGDSIINPNIGTSNHMYLAYRQGYFDDALIGIIDPCFDALNSVDIGVGEGAKNYFIAISSPLRGDADINDVNHVCGHGSVILERAGRNASGHEADTFRANPDGPGLIRIPGAIKSYGTFENYMTVAPNSDDQYAIKITTTGLDPLLSEDAAANSATFDAATGTLSIPKIRVDEQVFQATLNLQPQVARSANAPLKFTLADLNTLSLAEMLDTYRATYNPANQEVFIPRVTETVSGKAYTVIMKYAANADITWLELVSATEIK